jgi:hypothetical protein
MYYKDVADTFSGSIKNPWGYYFEACIRMESEKMMDKELIKVAEFYEEEARKCRKWAESTNYKGKMVASVMRPHGTSD